MLRDVQRLRAAAARVADDLNRTLDGPWRCDVSDDYLVTIDGPFGSESSALHPEVEDAAWFVRPDASDEEQAAGFEADAEEAVAQEVLELLDVLGVAWPICPEHGPRVGVCEGVWFCSGKPEHDVALVGSLRA